MKEDKGTRWMKVAPWFKDNRTLNQQKNKHRYKLMKENVEEMRRISEISSILSVFNNMMDEKEKEECERKFEELKQ
tara:strand:- start:114 stop:341 length:228 start_codon:yes stop_codon:yes gene_type:complete